MRIYVHKCVSANGDMRTGTGCVHTEKDGVPRATSQNNHLTAGKMVGRNHPFKKLRRLRPMGDRDLWPGQSEATEPHGTLEHGHRAVSSALCRNSGNKRFFRER